MAHAVARPQQHGRTLRLFGGWRVLAYMLAVGLMAIGVSGGICQALGWSMGDHALASDTLGAHLSAARCADLAEYYPGKTCVAAELAHHADEIVSYRLAAGVAGMVIAATLIGAAFAWKPSRDEVRRQVRSYAALAIAAFGVAAAALLGVGFARLATGGDAAPRWFSDGGVAAAFLLAHAAYAVRARDRAARLAVR